MDSLPKWDLWVNAKSMDDVKRDGRTQIFTTIFQAHLPNPDNAPLFIDLPAHKEGDEKSPSHSPSTPGTPENPIFRIPGESRANRQ
jgi:hypothetical protein